MTRYIGQNWFITPDQLINSFDHARLLSLTHSRLPITELAHILESRCFIA